MPALYFAYHWLATSVGLISLKSNWRTVGISGFNTRGWLGGVPAERMESQVSLSLNQHACCFSGSECLIPEPEKKKKAHILNSYDKRQRTQQNDHHSYWPLPLPRNPFSSLNKNSKTLLTWVKFPHQVRYKSIWKAAMTTQNIQYKWGGYFCVHCIERRLKRVTRLLLCTVPSPPSGYFYYTPAL